MTISSSLLTWLSRITLILFFSFHTPCAHAEPLTVTGAGATFPYPLYSKWFFEYNKAHPDIRFNYQSIGSGGGIKQITAKTVDFGASDAPMTDDELAKAGRPLLHIPTALGAVVISYNLPTLKSPLQLTGAVLADIFMGKITEWDDAKLKALNPTLPLPNQDILVAHRSDGSGTTHVFTDYLAKVSPEWQSTLGAGKAINWPTGLGGKGNEGVSGLISQMPGAIGYIELGYAMQNKLAVAALQNAAGKFITPTTSSVSSAAAGATIPADYRTSITHAGGDDSYPISALTYLLIAQTQTDPAKGAALVDFLKWAIHAGQALAPELHYAPLPEALVAKIDQTIGTIVVAKVP